MSTRGDRRAARRTAEAERIRQEQERDRRFGDRAHAGAMALQRRAWARGDGSPFAGYVEVTGPDGRTVRIAISRTGEYRDPEEGSRGAKLLDLLVLVPYVEFVVAAVIAVAWVSRWLFLELTGRPHFEVCALVDGTDERVVERTRRRPAAMRAASALADRVERDGTAALAPGTLAPGALTSAALTPR